MINVECSFPQNESVIRSAARLIVQLRFVIIWAFLKLVRWLSPNKTGIYKNDFEYIEWANKICKKKISNKLHDSYKSYVEGINASPNVFDAIIFTEWWEGKTVLEVGSGLGQSACHIANKGAKRVTGVECSYKKVSWSKSYYGEGASRNLEFISGSAESLCFPDNNFDFIFSNSVLEHVKDPKKALQEIYRVAKPGGELLLAVDYFHGPAGNHLYDYVYFPWATTLVSEGALCQYWSEKIKKDQKIGKMGFYAPATKIENLGEGSEIQLNRWNSDQMEQAMVEAGWVIEKKVPSLFIGIVPIIRSFKSLKFYLQGAGIYRLVKN
jgi:ubiquinone/menaquinone biosynthesis C-methylase UbiE